MADREGADREGPATHTVAELVALLRMEQIEENLFRAQNGPGTHARSAEAPHKHTWLRIKERLPDDPVIHAALLGYMSDLDFMSTAMLPHGPSFEIYSVQGASLDHAMWFHRPFRADEWLLFAKESPVAWGARGFVRGQFFDRHGTLVASAAQECLMRPRLKEVGIAS